MAKYVESIMEDRLQPENDRPLTKDEVLGEDGMIHCIHCHEPRQRWCEIDEEWHKTPLRCACQLSEYERRQRDNDRYQRSIEHNEWCIEDNETWRNCRFSQDDGRDPNATAKAKAYVWHFGQMLKRDAGMMLIGEVGSGKTFLAACIREALHDEYSVSMTTLSRLITLMNDHYGRDRTELLNKITGADLLILDDFGVERATEYSLEQSYEAINARYKSGKPLIITTNLTLQQLQEEQNLALRRIYDRVIEKCIPLLVKGESRRGEIAGEKRREAMKVLGMG